MALPNARNQYLKTQIETASKEQLVVMLFDGIIRFTEQARKAIQEEKIEESHNALMRAQAIVMELICTIDKEKGGEVANGMMSLHAYAFNCLVVCNMKKDFTKIDEVQKIYRELREAWVGAMDSLGIASHAGKPVETAPTSAVAPTVAGQSASAPITAQPVGAVMPGLSGQQGGVMAAAAPAPQAGIATPPKPAVVPTPAMLTSAAAPKPPTLATGYGMGKTAMLNTGKPLAAPATPPVASQPSQVASASVNAKQAAMLNAYSSGTRSIA